MPTPGLCPDQIGGTIMGIFVNGMFGGHGTLLAELYPTEARATAEKVQSRPRCRALAFVVGALAASHSFAGAISMLSVIYVIDIIATYYLIPERRGLPLR